jgi:Tfp pilus assembly protein PilZ
MNNHTKKKKSIERRKLPRQACFKKIGYAYKDYSYMDYITDINSWGAFINTRKSVPVGENISVSIPILEHEKTIKVIGEVIRASHDGIGIKFKMGIDDSAISSILKND